MIAAAPFQIGRRTYIAVSSPLSATLIATTRISRHQRGVGSPSLSQNRTVHGLDLVNIPGIHLSVPMSLDRDATLQPALYGRPA